MNPVSQSLPKCDQLRKDRWVRARICVVTCFLVLGFTGVTWRLIYLHINQHEKSSSIAAGMRQQHQDIPAHRGSIRDRNGELLAHDRAVFDLYADRFHLREMHLISRRLAALQGTTVTALRKTKSEGQILDAYHLHIAMSLSG